MDRETESKLTVVFVGLGRRADERGLDKALEHCCRLLADCDLAYRQTVAGMLGGKLTVEIIDILAQLCLQSAQFGRSVDVDHANIAGARRTRSDDSARPGQIALSGRKTPD
ncbi:MAG: hypothetical protein MJE77_04190 [Proteobacteria bacterium]|nr:hypothetical protein [Pseudomonadota bacterium]